MKKKENISRKQVKTIYCLKEILTNQTGLVTKQRTALIFVLEQIFWYRKRIWERVLKDLLFKLYIDVGRTSWWICNSHKCCVGQNHGGVTSWVGKRCSTNITNNLDLNCLVLITSIWCWSSGDAPNQIQPPTSRTIVPYPITSCGEQVAGWEPRCIASITRCGYIWWRIQGCSANITIRGMEMEEQWNQEHEKYP